MFFRTAAVFATASQETPSLAKKDSVSKNFRLGFLGAFEPSQYYLFFPRGHPKISESTCEPFPWIRQRTLASPPMS